MPRPAIPTHQLIAVLTSGPADIAAHTAGLSSAQLRRPPRRGEWSPVAILAHLRSCADVWGAGIAAILREDHPTIRAISPRTWIEDTDYLELEFKASLRAFARQRSGLLKVLRSLSEEDWTRSATVTGAGAARQWTVHAYVERLARHERAHVQQIRRAATFGM